MGTYADFFNAQYRGPIASNPVRLTIGRGDGAMQEETWVEEELMDQVEESELAPPVRARSAALREAQHDPAPALLLPFATYDSAVWVIDTFLHVLRPFFDVLFAAALHSATPVYLFVPHIVLEELDGMKHSERRMETGKVGAAARQASHWLLETVQRQKQTAAAYSRTRWVLHVQTQARRDPLPTTSLVCNSCMWLTQTNDQTIVALCAELSQNHNHVYLVSNDTNARTLAEIEGVTTLSFGAVIEALGPRNEAARRLFDLCAASQYTYLLFSPECLASIQNDAWQQMREASSRLLPDPQADVAMTLT